MMNMTDYCKSLEKQVELLRNEVDIISSMYLKIQDEMDLNSYLDEVIETLRSRVNFDGCNIAIIDGFDNLRVHKIDYSKISKKSKLSKAYLDSIYSRKLNYKTDNDLSCIVVREDMEIHYPEINLSDFREEDRKFFVNYGISGLFYLPLKVGETIIGVMRFHNYSDPMPLSNYEKRLIRRRTSLIARAIDNFMLYSKVRDKNEEIRQDLELARKIQYNLLPQAKPSSHNIDVATDYRPMSSVGGDYFDYIQYADDSSDKFSVFITDASGHGVAAAFITSMVKMIFQSERVLQAMDSPPCIISYINGLLCDKIAQNFVTGLFCTFDLIEGTYSVASAGHPPLIKYDRTNDIISNINPRGMPMGITPGATFGESKGRCGKGDRFIFYTDGLIETINPQKVPFEDMLPQHIRDCKDVPAQQFVEQTIDALYAHGRIYGEQTLKDDLAIVVVDIL